MQNIMTLRSRVYLGDVLRALGRETEAEAMLVPSYEYLLAQRGAEHAQTRFALQHVVRLYETAGRTREAARYRALMPADSGLAAP